MIDRNDARKQRDPSESYVTWWERISKKSNKEFSFAMATANKKVIIRDWCK